MAVEQRVADLAARADRQHHQAPADELRLHEIASEQSLTSRSRTSLAQNPKAGPILAAIKEQPSALGHYGGRTRPI